MLGVSTEPRRVQRALGRVGIGQPQLPNEGAQEEPVEIDDTVVRIIRAVAMFLAGYFVGKMSAENGKGK